MMTSYTKNFIMDIHKKSRSKKCPSIVYYLYNVISYKCRILIDIISSSSHYKNYFKLFQFKVIFSVACPDAFTTNTFPSAVTFKPNSADADEGLLLKL